MLFFDIDNIIFQSKRIKVFVNRDGGRKPRTGMVRIKTFRPSGSPGSSLANAEPCFVIFKMNIVFNTRHKCVLRNEPMDSLIEKSRLLVSAISVHNKNCP